MSSPLTHSMCKSLACPYLFRLYSDQQCLSIARKPLLLHICLLLAAYDLVQLNLQTDLESTRGLIELIDLASLITKSEYKASFTTKNTDFLSAVFISGFGGGLVMI